MFNDWKRFRKLEEKVEDLELRFKKLDREFTDLYDNVRTTFSKYAKRIERHQKELADAEQTPDVAQPGEVLPAAAGLTDRQARIQAQILARRKGNGLLPG